MTTADGTIAGRDELRLVHALRQGDETAFVSLLDRYHASLVRFARTFVHDREWAEEVVQETWVGVVRDIDGFRSDSSLKAWIYQVMIDTATTRAAAEHRSLPFSALSAEAGEAAVDPERFLPDGGWASAPTSWGSIPEERLLADEARSCIQDAIEALPPSQRQVVTLRDIEGWSSDEVCALLALSETDQRALLHHARSRLRMALEDHLGARDALDASPAPL